MCGGVHYGEVEGLVSVERWSYSRGAHVWNQIWINRTPFLYIESSKDESQNSAHFKAYIVL